MLNCCCTRMTCSAAKEQPSDELQAAGWRIRVDASAAARWLPYCEQCELDYRCPRWERVVAALVRNVTPKDDHRILNMTDMQTLLSATALTAWQTALVEARQR
jgi:hypothetical protein